MKLLMCFIALAALCGCKHTDDACPYQPLLMTNVHVVNFNDPAISLRVTVVAQPGRIISCQTNYVWNPSATR